MGSGAVAPGPVVAGRRSTAHSPGVRPFHRRGTTRKAAEHRPTEPSTGQYFPPPDSDRHATFLAIPLLWRGRTRASGRCFCAATNTGPGSTAPDPMVVVARFALVQGPMLLAAAAGVAGYEPAWIALTALAVVQIGLVWNAKDWNGGAELRLGIVIQIPR